MWPKNDSILSVLQQTGDKTNCCANNGRMQNLSGHIVHIRARKISHKHKYGIKVGIWVCFVTIIGVLVAQVSIKRSYEVYCPISTQISLGKPVHILSQFLCQLLDKSIKIKQWQEDLVVRFKLLLRALIFYIILDQESYMQDFS